MNKRIFISTGEVSGDLHGSLLANALLSEAKLRSIDFFLASLNKALANKLPCKSPETSPVLMNIFLFIN